MITIQESSMNFGPFENCDIFYIEKSNIYKKIQQGMKIAEFLVIMRNDLVYIIEAKSSAPNPNNKNSTGKFEEFIEEITQKLMNALTLSMSTMIGRHDTSEVPDKLMNCLSNSSNVTLVLVLKEHPLEALVPVHDALKQRLSVQSKIWRFEVAVINEDIARTQGLVQ